VVHKMEDEHWHFVLNSLANHFGVKSSVSQQNMLVDSRIQWNQIGNIRHNAAVHTGIYLALTPFRWVFSIIKRRS
jgi:hypothetical protein